MVRYSQKKLQFENNAYQTAKVNEAVLMICTLEAALKEDKIKQTDDEVSLSNEVNLFGRLSNQIVEGLKILIF